MQNAEHLILIAEDNHHDAFLLRRAFDIDHFHCRLYFVRDGQEAIDYMTGKDHFRDREQFPLPELILTDLRMPRVTGEELLEWIRAQRDFNRLPIVVITGSNLSPTERRTIESAADALVEKDVVFQQPEEFLKLMKKFVKC